MIVQFDQLEESPYNDTIEPRPLHPRYQAMRPPRSKQDGCECQRVWNAVCEFSGVPSWLKK